MATFKAEIQRYQRRKDGTYPVSIRLTHNRKIVRIPTGLYVDDRQINKKTFEIKDQFVLVRTNQTITEYRERLLSIGTTELKYMTAEQLENILVIKKGRLDYLGFCKQLVEKDSKRYCNLKQVLVFINEMGIKEMTPEDVTSQFIIRFKAFIDQRLWISPQKKENASDGKKGRKYKAKTKNGYLAAISNSFNEMCKTYNTDFVKVIKHQPEIQYYEKEETKKKTLTKEELRKFIEYKPRTDAQELAKDICLLSFGLCGCNIIDLLKMKKSNYIEEYNRIFYSRSKTGIRTSVKIPSQVQYLFDKYRCKSGDHLFKFGRYTEESVNADQNVCSSLRAVSKKLELEKLTPYWFRHTWASIARNKCGASKDDVDQGLAHAGDNPMADVYIKSEWDVLDKLAQDVQNYVYND